VSSPRTFVGIKHGSLGGLELRQTFLARPRLTPDAAGIFRSVTLQAFLLLLGIKSKGAFLRRITTIPLLHSLNMLFTIICIFVASVAAHVLSVNDCSQWNDGSQICVRANLYRDGTLASEITTESDSFLHGCRGGAMVVGSDDAGKALWTTKLQGKAACSLGDTSCASFQRHEIVAHVDTEAAKHTSRIHLFYNFDGNICEERSNKA
jgi:hypothetical protein